MLSRKNRLKRQKEIERVLKRGQGFKEGFLAFKVLRNDLGICRFGFIVSLKVSKKATLRYKIKRRMREAVRARMTSLIPGCDGLFIAQPGIEKMRFGEVKGLVDRLLNKAKLFQHDQENSS